MPAYWKVLATPVPDEQGRAHFHDVHIWNIKATGAKTAFQVDAFPQLPVDDFRLDHLTIQAQTAGHIADAKGWKFSDISLSTADGSVVGLSDDSDITGIASKAMQSPPTK